MSKGLVSVIIPMYNVEKYIQKCVKSVIEQTYKNLEIICIDDGSPDNSTALVSKFMKDDSRISIVFQENMGLSGARNSGIQLAKGEYIMFLDGDDWIDIDTVETAVNEIEKENAQLVMWNYVREYPDKSLPKNVFNEKRIVFENEKMQLLHRRMAGLVGEELHDPSNADSAITAWGKLYKTEKIKNIAFVDTKIIGTEDALFSLQALCNIKKAVFISNYFNHYRKDNGNSLTRKYKPKLFAQWQTLYDKMGEVIKENNLPFEEALSNRIALSIIGLGLNKLIDTTSFWEKSKKVKNAINSQRYKNAYQNLDLKYFPIHWKLFFASCKTGNGFLVLLLLKCIDKIISR